MKDVYESISKDNPQKKQQNIDTVFDEMIAVMLRDKEL